tara:strand:- start:695 stop:1828 length:1134 start_codon:yes stop_codon:yes gene_type:complete
MGLIKKFKDISLIGLGDLTANGISAVFWFYLATLILPSEYGQIHYFISIAAIASTMSLVGQQHTIVVFISKNKNIFSTLFLVSIICSIISFIILTIFFDKFDIGLLTIGMVLFTHGIASNLGYEDYKKYAIFSIFQKVLMIVLGFGFLYSFGVETILLGIALSYFVYVKIFFTGLIKFKINFSELKNNRNFISSNYFIMLTNIVTAQVDKLLIVPILGFTVLGNYSLAIQVITIMSILPSVIFKYILPKSSRGIQDEKLRIKTIFLSVVLAGVGIFILPTIIPIFFDKFSEVVLIIQIMSLSIIPITINTFYFSKFLGSENAKIPLFGGIISSTVLVTGMIALGNLYGTVGIAVTHVLTYSSLCTFSYFMDKKIKIS